MNILGFDTALEACSIALQTSQGDIFVDHQEQVHGHAEVLTTRVEKILEEAGLTFHDLNLLTTTTGPGSFTGLRVGLAAAQGYSLSTGLPLIGVTTLEMLSQGIEDNFEKRIVAAIDSKRGDFYVQIFDEHRNPLTQPDIATEGELADKIRENSFVAVGNAAHHVARVLSNKEILVYNKPVQATTLLKIAKEQYESGQNMGHPNNCKPIYLRSADATVPINQSVKVLNE